MHTGTNLGCFMILGQGGYTVLAIKSYRFRSIPSRATGTETITKQYEYAGPAPTLCTVRTCAQVLSSHLKVKVLGVTSVIKTHTTQFNHKQFTSKFNFDQDYLTDSTTIPSPPAVSHDYL